MTLDPIRHARGLIEDGEAMSGVWPRAAALLTRQALEDALDRLWAAGFPCVEQASRFTQLACLDQILDDRAVISDVRSAWASLSRACHHHHYELAPTAAELERWIQQTERLVKALERVATKEQVDSHTDA